MFCQIRFQVNDIAGKKRFCYGAAQQNGTTHVNFVMVLIKAIFTYLQQLKKTVFNALDALEVLQTRNSAPRLTGSVPGDALNEMLKAGLRAPDHAQLRPWRIVVVEGEGRDRLGALFARAKLTSNPDESAEALAKLRGKPMRAPVIIVVAARITEHPKVPEIEQVLSAGAVAQNILNAAHALGYGAMWRTGSMAFDPVVREGLGFDDNHRIVGFLYVGEVDGRRKVLPELNPDDFVTRWY